MDRRRFIGICSASLAALQMRSWASQDTKIFKLYSRARLTLPSGETLHARHLSANTGYVFHYPYVSTPCLLLQLNAPIDIPSGLKTTNGQAYSGVGGVGPDRSIVAFSAICPHQLSYLSKAKSFINYRADTSEVAKRNNVIVCCAHHSVYDPSAGGRAVSGPAPEPLTGIVLQHDSAEDALYAIGTAGGELFSAFFRAYKIELIEAYGRGVAKQLVEITTVVQTVRDYVAKPILC